MFVKQWPQSEAKTSVRPPSNGTVITEGVAEKRPHKNDRYYYRHYPTWVRLKRPISAKWPTSWCRFGNVSSANCGTTGQMALRPRSCRHPDDFSFPGYDLYLSREVKGAHRGSAGLTELKRARTVGGPGAPPEPNIGRHPGTDFIRVFTLFDVHTQAHKQRRAGRPR